MNPKDIGAMIARAAGVVLLVIGLSSLLLCLPSHASPGTAVAGWTSYSPLVTNISTLHSHDTYIVVPSPLYALLPGLVQAVAGLLLILLSRPVGRLLAKGLTEERDD
jgi:hypothetical protein